MSGLLHLLQEVANYHDGNFTPTTIVWTLLGAIGTIITILNLKDAVKDTEALVMFKADDGRKRELLAMAAAGVRMEVLRLSKMLVITAIGIVVAVSTPVISDEQREALHIPYWTPVGVALTLALIYIVAVIVIQALLDRRLRRRFYSGE
jgi:hypothetical protein